MTTKHRDERFRKLVNWEAEAFLGKDKDFSPLSEAINKFDENAVIYIVMVTRF